MTNMTDDACPLVSVIVRSMDRPSLQDALDSIGAQSYPNIEVILVNAKGSAHQHQGDVSGPIPIRFISPGTQLGRSNAANIGLKNALGQYLVFLDDDDWFEPDHIQSLMNAFKFNPTFKVAYTGVKCVDGNGTLLHHQFDASFDAVKLLSGNFIPIHAVLFSRTLIELGCYFDESLDLYEDWDFWIQLSQHVDFLKVKGLSAVYRITAQSGFGLNATPQVRMRSSLLVYSKWIHRLKESQLSSLMQAVSNSFSRENELYNLKAKLDQTLFDRDLEIIRLNQAVSDHDLEISKLKTTLDSMQQTISWRVTKPLRLLRRYSYWFARQIKLAHERGVLNRAKALLTKLLAQRRSQKVTSSYSIWSREFDTPSSQAIHKLSSSTPENSLIFIVARFDESTEKYAPQVALRLIQSVGQHWLANFIFHSNCDTKKITDRIQHAIKDDPRISFNVFPTDSPIDFILWIEGAALIREHALRTFTDALRSKPNALVAYSDEDQINSSGLVFNPWFKPQFSPLLIQQDVLLGRAIAFRPKNATLRSFADTLSFSNDVMDFIRNYALQAGEDQVIHIPHVLFHDALPVRAARPISFPLPKILPVVSIIIPTRDRWDLLGACLESLKSTDWPTDCLDIIVIDNGSTEPLSLKGMADAQSQQAIRVIRDDQQFNWSRLNNLGALKAEGEVFVFLNNDTEVLDREWLKKLCAYALMPSTGAVGCKLLYPDRTVQHGGVVAGIQGVAAHAHLHLQAIDGGYRNLANTHHEVSAVTGACLAVTRSNFDSVGGFNESLRVAFSDVIFCFDLHTRGQRNVYVSDPLFVHHESKSRGYDDTPEKLLLNRTEARQTWSIHPALMRSDPFYSPNLSLLSPYHLSPAPRRRSAWDDPTKRPPRVMMLSITHAVGHGVAVVMALQAKALVDQGYEVLVAGPVGSRDFAYPGCERIDVNDPLSAAIIAAKRSVDLIIAQTPPFFSVARWTGSHPPVLAIDHGEPPAEWFPDAENRRLILQEKDQSLMMAHTVMAISSAVQAESRTPVHGILPNGNSHLGQWDEQANLRRQRVRLERGWEDKFVVLNVCRFHRSERHYKGVNTYADVFNQLSTLDPTLFEKTCFVLCGKGLPHEVIEMKNLGLFVAANVSDEEMIDLYCAADAYANFSKWEGYNLGIGQALALGLPSIASDIPAHRNFGIDVTNEPEDAALWLIKVAAEQHIRKPLVWKWEHILPQLIDAANSICARTK